MKRIMLLLFAVLLIPIYSHAISLDELLTAIAETPKRFDVNRDSNGTFVIDHFTSTSDMTNNNSTLVWSVTGYNIFSFAPNYIYEIRMRYVIQGEPNSTLADLAKNGVTVSREVLSVHAYAFDGTFLPNESQKILPLFQSALKRKSQQERNPSAFI